MRQQKFLVFRSVQISQQKKENMSRLAVISIVLSVLAVQASGKNDFYSNTTFRCDGRNSTFISFQMSNIGGQTCAH